jgi:hypothetical protein
VGTLQYRYFVRGRLDDGRLIGVYVALEACVLRLRFEPNRDEVWKETVTGPVRAPSGSPDPIERLP